MGQILAFPLHEVTASIPEPDLQFEILERLRHAGSDIELVVIIKIGDFRTLHSRNKGRNCRSKSTVSLIQQNTDFPVSKCHKEQVRPAVGVDVRTRHGYKARYSGNRKWVACAAKGLTV